MRESSWGAKNPLILAIAGVLKLLRVNLGGSTDDPPVERLQPFEVASLPDEVRKDLKYRVDGVAAYARDEDDETDEN